MSVEAAKVALRSQSRARRRGIAPGPGPAAMLALALAPHAGRVLGGYLAAGREADPLAAMAAFAGPVCVPVVLGPDLPLGFCAWTPGCETAPGAYGIAEPVRGAALVPQVLIVPLLAFDAAGRRLGQGGGFYDRTLAALRGAGPLLAIGFGYAGQEVDAVPAGPHDAPLDLVVTEAGLVVPAR